MYFVMGSKSDPQSIAMSELGHETFWWEEYGTAWKLTFHDGKCSLHGLGLERSEILINSEVRLYLRFPYQSENKMMSQAHLLLRELCKENLLSCGEIAGNKATQLSYFGKLCPKTMITNKRAVVEERTNWICKGISANTRTEVAQVSQFLGGQLKGAKITVPVLIQEPCFGQEFKVHFLFRHSEPEVFGVEIKSKSLDYRHSLDSETHYQKAIAPKESVDLGMKLHRELGIRNFDLDVRMTAAGELKAFEWNSSPAYSWFEILCGLTPEFSKKTFYKEAVVCLGTQEDRTLNVFHRFASQSRELNLVFLHYDDFDQKWSFNCTDGKISIQLGNEEIIPKALYHRGVHLTPNAPHRKGLLSWLLALNLAKVPVLSKPMGAYFNGSKPYQMTTSLKQNGISQPKSWIFKGSPETFHASEIRKRSCIVKSLSGVRSHVVDEQVFNHWDFNALSALPTLFQEKIVGRNLRSHWINEKTWTVAIKSEENVVDYRYANAETPKMEMMELSPLILEGMKAAAEFEGNKLVGFDFIEEHATGDLYCLEANPGPGWSYFLMNGNSEARQALLGMPREILSFLNGEMAL